MMARTLLYCFSLRFFVNRKDPNHSYKNCFLNYSQKVDILLPISGLAFTAVSLHLPVNYLWKLEKKTFCIPVSINHITIFPVTDRSLPATYAARGLNCNIYISIFFQRLCDSNCNNIYIPRRQSKIYIWNIL